MIQDDSRSNNHRMQKVRWRFTRDLLQGWQKRSSKERKVRNCAKRLEMAKKGQGILTK